MPFGFKIGLALALAGALLSAAVWHQGAELRAQDEAYAEVSTFIARADYDRMMPIHQRMLGALVRENSGEGGPQVAACWEADPNNWAAIQAFNLAIAGTTQPSGADYQTGTRWSTTASGNSSGQGSPVTLTYSFVPDGTNIPSSSGSPAAPSSLFAWLNGIYGTPAVWQTIFAEEFQRWGAQTGVTYVYEPNDDGVSSSSSAGVLGVRGDVRIGAKFIDGNSNVLAYNSFPQNGDMVFDANDSFYNNTTNNSRRLRNVIAHEHGHGLGLFHVCPANGQKLMEPFINTNFLGPQHDDRRGGQRQYGDQTEPNDTAGTATPLGLTGLGSVTLQDVSLDDNSDNDYYSLTVSAPATFNVTAVPDGLTYTAGAQLSICGDQTEQVNSLVVHDLALEVRNASATTVLASSNTSGVGQAESLLGVQVASAGTYLIRVFGGSADAVQLYDLTVTVTMLGAPAFTIVFPGGVPTTVPADVPTTVSFQTVNGASSPNPTSGQLATRVNGGNLVVSPISNVGGNNYQMTFPAVPCFGQLEWYVQLTSISGSQVITAPAGAPAVFNETVGLGTVAFADDFNTNLGWTVTNTAGLTDGAWERAIPAGGGDRGDPVNDGDGSGLCYVTDNADGNSDVDGGGTILTSPAIDLAGAFDVRISYLFWYDNEAGGNPNQDTFEIEISDNGTTWVTVESYNANNDSWNPRTIDPANFVNLTSNVRMRFIAQDLGTGSVVEAGIDAFRVEVCDQAVSLSPACAGGFVGAFSGTGGPHAILTANGSAGNAQFRVDVPVNTAYPLAVQAPPGVTAPSGIALYGLLGVPLASEIFNVGPFIGSFCFAPCPAAPSDPRGFTLTNSFVPDPCGQVFPSVALPISINVPALPFPYVITIQGIISETVGFITLNSVTNAIAINYQ